MVDLVKGAKTSSDAAENAVKWQSKMEELNAEVHRRHKPKGYFKQNPPLLEERRFSHLIADGFFAQQMVYDRILVRQLGQEEQETYGDTMIIRPEASAKAERESAPRGIICSAGLKALDNLRANGIDLGHIVTFIKHAPWHMKIDNVLGHDMYGLILRDGDITGSEDLSASLVAGTCKIEMKEFVADGVTVREHFFVDDKGETWNPQQPFIGDDY